MGDTIFDMNCGKILIGLLSEDTNGQLGLLCLTGVPFGGLGIVGSSPWDLCLPLGVIRVVVTERCVTSDMTGLTKITRVRKRVCRIN